MIDSGFIHTYFHMRFFNPDFIELTYQDSMYHVCMAIEHMYIYKIAIISADKCHGASFKTCLGF